MCKHGRVQLHVLGESDVCKKGESAEQWPDYKSKSVSYVEDVEGVGVRSFTMGGRRTQSLYVLV